MTTALTMVAGLLVTTPAEAVIAPTPEPKASPASPIEIAKSAAKRSGRPEEIPSLHTEGSTTYANGDGKTLKTEFYAAPVRVRRQGSWHPIDTTLIQDNGVVRPRMTKSDLTLSGGGDTTLLTATDTTAASERTAATAAKLFAPATLPTPKLTGNRAEYANVYGPGIHLVVTATPTGYRQELVIDKKPESRLNLRVPIQLSTGSSYRADKSGKLTLRRSTSSGEKQDIAVPPAFMLDSGADFTTGKEGRVGKVTSALENTGGKTQIVLSPDAGFLSDPGTTYPVTLVAVSTDWMQLSVGNDTFINNSAYQNGYANSGAQHLQAGMTDNGTVRWRTYLRFEEIPEESPLRDAKVTNADLILWNIRSNDCGEQVGSGITARRITQRWDVSTLTWNNQPPVTGTGADNEPGAYEPGCGRGYMDYEWYLIHYVNDIVQAWANGEPNYGFQLTSGSESERTNWRAYRSKELTDPAPAHGPKLVIGYEPAVTQDEYIFAVHPVSDRGKPFDYDYEKAHEVAPRTTEWPALTDEEIQSLKDRINEPFMATSESLTPDDEEGWPEPEPEPAPDETCPPQPTPAPSATCPPDPPVGPVLSELSVTPSELVSGTLVASVLDPKLQAFVADPQDLPSRVEVEVEHDPAAPAQGTGRIWTGAVDNVESATQAVIQIPAGTLSNEWQVRWRARATAGGTASEWTAWQNFAVIDGPAPLPIAELKVDPSTQDNAVTSSLTPALLARVDDPMSRTTKLDFEVEHDPAVPGQGSGQIWAGSVDDVANGEFGSVQIPAGEVADLWQVRWRARANADGVAGAWSDWRTLKIDVPKPMVSDLQASPLRDDVSPPTTTSLVPELFARAFDPVDGSATVDFEVEHDPAVPGQGSGQIWAGSVDDVANGEFGSVQVPAGELADLWQVRWRARAKAGGVSGTWSDWQVLRVDAAKPSVSDLDFAPSATVGGNRVATSLTPTLYALTTDPDGRSSSVEFQVEHDSVLVWSGTKTNVPDDSYGSITVPSGKLQDLWEVRWRARATVGTAIGAWSDWEAMRIDAAKPSVSDLDFAPSATVGGNRVATSLTPTLYALTTDPDGRSSSVEFQVEHDSVLVWSGTKTNVPDDSYGSITVPSGKLQDLWEVRWRARATVGTAIGAWSDWEAMRIDAAKPSVSDLDFAPSATVGGNRVATSLTPTLYALTTDPDGRSSSVEFQVEHDSVLVWSGTKTNVPDDSYGSITVPSGKLQDLWQVRWRARATAGGAAGAWSDWQTIKIDISKPSVTDLDVSPSTVVNGTLVTSSLTPTLYAAVADPEGRSATMEFQVEHDPAVPAQGSGLIWSGTKTGVSNNSYGSVTVATGKLQNQWQVRWRARATAGGAAGAWSGWAALKVNTASLPGPAKVANAGGPLSDEWGPEPGPWGSREEFFNHASWDECWNKRPDLSANKARPQGWYKSPYSWCHSAMIKYTYVKIKIIPYPPYVKRAKVGSVEIVFSTLARTVTGKKLGPFYVKLPNGKFKMENGKKVKRDPTAAERAAAATGGREIYIETRFHDLDLDDANGDWWEEVALSPRVWSPGWGSPAQSCSPTGGSYGPARTLAASNGSVWRTHFTSATNNGSDMLATCSLVPEAELQHDDETRMYTLQDKNFLPTVRCDSSDLVKANYTGCIFLAGIPSWGMPRQDKIKYRGRNIPNYMKEHADHVWTALNDPTRTKPALGFKDIPGLETRRKWLTRTTDDSTYNRNVAVKDRYCYGKDSVFTDEERAPRNGEEVQCDEYPFARTLEGAGYNERDFSLKFIGSKANQAGGATQSIFWSRYRVLNGDRFYVFPETDGR